MLTTIHKHHYTTTNISQLKFITLYKEKSKLSEYWSMILELLPKQGFWIMILKRHPKHFYHDHYPPATLH